MAATVIKQVHQLSLANQRLQAVLKIWERKKTPYSYHWLYVCARHKGEKMRAIWVRSDENAFDYFEREIERVLSKATSFEVEMLHSPEVRHLSSSAKNQWNSLRGKQAMEIGHGGKTSRWAATEMLARNLGFSNVLNRHLADVKCKIDPKASIPVTLYQTLQWFCDNTPSPQSHASPVEMFRGNRVVEIESVNRASVLRCAQAMTRWLSEQVSDTGAVRYKYWPSRGAYASSNNAIRQWMATVCLGRAAQSFGSESLAIVAAKNLAYNLSTTYQTDGKQSYIWMNGSAKLGAAALAALAILESPQRKQFLKEEHTLHKVINSLGNPDGSFDTFYIPRERKDNQNFYSGEALLFLASRYVISRNPAELKRFMAGFHYYRDWHCNNRNPAFVPWHTQAYYLVWQVTKEGELKDFIFEMNDWLLSMQQWQSAEFIDMQGRFYDPERPYYGPPHASSTGVYLEGLADAFALAKQCDESHRAERYRMAIVRGIRSIMQLQYKNEIDCYYIKNTDKVLGGIRTTVYDNTIRIDNVQHALMAFFKIYSCFSDKSFENTVSYEYVANIKHKKQRDSTGWNAESILDATQGYWVVQPSKNWVAYSFCIEENFFNVGDVVFIKGKNRLSNNEKIKLYLNRGASGFIVDGDSSVDDFVKLPILKVGSISSSLKSMAIYHRSRMKAKVIAITGSVGKSTTREILYHLLSTKYKVYRTYANYNLFTGVQLSIVNTPIQSDYAVYEMAIGSPGSLSKSSYLAKPDAVVLTDISEAHLQKHISIENVVLEKLQILDSLYVNGCVAYFGESKSTRMIKLELDKRKINNRVVYGHLGSSNIQLLSNELRLGNQTISFCYEEKVRTEILNLPGQHNAMNALAAIAILPKVGADFDECVFGLVKVKPTKGRMEHIAINLINGSAVLVDDAFNANPASMMAAIEYLDLLKKGSTITRTIFVCSDMLELGSTAMSAHIELTNSINRSGIDLIVMTGDMWNVTHNMIGKNKQKVYVDNINSVIEYLKRKLMPSDVVLVKGSRSTKIYKVSDALRNLHYSRPEEYGSEPENYIPGVKRICLNPVGGGVFDLYNESHFSTIATNRIIYPASLSKIFGLCYLYEAISINQELLNSEVNISKYAASVASKWILEEGERVKVRDLIHAAAICASNEAMIALAEWCSGSEEKFAFDITCYARKIGLKQSIFRNATGLFNEGHVSSIQDIFYIIKRVKIEFPELNNIFSDQEFRFRGEVYKNTNPYKEMSNINGFQTGRTPKSGFNLAASSIHNGGERIAIVVGCHSKCERDDLALELLNLNVSKLESISNTFSKCSNSNNFYISKDYGNISISILGDTYFGEYYDENRFNSGKTNYIEKYGYQHSLKNIARFLAGNDLNIVNLEASLTNRKVSPLAGKKKWILGADPGKTIETLRAYRIEGVLLGNNHTYDYGIDELPFGISELNASDIASIGAGRNEDEACSPMIVDVAIGCLSRKLYVFSGYAYNKYEDRHFSCYADKYLPGVNNITSDNILKKISEIRHLDHSAYIVISPHWGENYKWVNSSQRHWAEKYIDAGADIIVGHGAHMLQEIESIRGRPVIYSLGNFIFNSNGEYRRRGVPPFSLLFQLKAAQRDGEIKFTFDLMPFFCANHECGFQPRPATAEEINFLSDSLGVRFSSYV